jgi:2-C-methyl-D-erythritol 4-phosphate cytidylyltransferase
MRPAYDVATVILAAGSGRRMGTSVNKVLLPIAGRHVLARTVDQFELHRSIGRIVIVAADHELEQVRQIIDATGAAKVTDIVAGGPTRHASEWNGILALAPAIESGTVGIVLVHDGARPSDAVRDHGDTAAVVERETDISRTGGTYSAVEVQYRLAE